MTVDDDTPIALAGTSSTGTVDEDGVLEGAADAGPGDGIPGGPDDFVDLEHGWRQRQVDDDGNGVEPVPVRRGRAADLFAVDGYEWSDGAGPDVWRRGADLFGGGNVLTAEAGAGNTVFTFSLNPTTGAWVFNLEDQLDHPTLDGLPGDNTENDLTILLGSLIQATDCGRRHGDRRCRRLGCDGRRRHADPDWCDLVWHG